MERVASAAKSKVARRTAPTRAAAAARRRRRRGRAAATPPRLASLAADVRVDALRTAAAAAAPRSPRELDGSPCVRARAAPRGCAADTPPPRRRGAACRRERVAFWAARADSARHSCGARRVLQQRPRAQRPPSAPMRTPLARCGADRRARAGEAAPPAGAGRRRVSTSARASCALPRASGEYVGLTLSLLLRTPVAARVVSSRATCGRMRGRGRRRSPPRWRGAFAAPPPPTRLPPAVSPCNLRSHLITTITLRRRLTLGVTPL